VPLLIASLDFFYSAISVPVVLLDLTGAPGMVLRPPPLLLEESFWVEEAAFSVDDLCEKAPFMEPCERCGNCPGPELLETREERWEVPASWSNLERTALGFEVVSFRLVPLDLFCCYWG
jgi:hypothetical protein